MSRSHISLGVSLLLSLGVVACSSDPAADSDDMVESAALMLITPNVPSDVKCIVLTVAGPGATVTRAFDVTPSQPANMTATGLPIGSVTVTEAAYDAPCSLITAQTPLTWVSTAPVVVQLIAGQSTSVSIELRRAGGLIVTTSFNDGASGNNPPTIATAASATPNPVLGTSATLSVLGADDNGESNLTYTWATTGTPPAAVTFGSNGTNAAKVTTATFTAAGTYSFQVTVKDQGGLTALSAASVTVTAKLTSIVITPTTSSVTVSTTQQFTAVAQNQFSVALSPQPTFTWAVSGGGSISASGLFTAGPTSGGPYTVTASSSGVSGMASMTVLPAPTRVVVYQINSGSSSAVSPFSADTYMSGGTAHAVTNTIATTGVTSPAPMAVYQTERYGNVTYTLPNLTASSQYVVRLHFAEIYWTSSGKRSFNVSINGAAVLSNFDIYSAAGGQYKAHVREFTATANASGQIVIVFTKVIDNASICGIEVLALKYPNGASCSQPSQCESGQCTNGVCVSGCAEQSSYDLIPGAGFDTASTLANWTSAGGTSWNGNDDVDACSGSGSVSFAGSGSMSYCYKSAMAATYYLGMKGKGSVGCLGMFHSDTNCTTALGPDFLNLGATDSATWMDTYTAGVPAPSGTQSILITCFANTSAGGAIDQIYLNRGASTGFAGTPSCTQQSTQDLISGAGFDTTATLANWTSAGGTSWSSDDAEGCGSSGAVSFTSTGSMTYCHKSATTATYYLGMKGKGSVGCLGMFHSDANCTTALGPDFLNLGPTNSATWKDTYTMGVPAPSGTQSILISCSANGSGPGAIDQIYLNQGSSTGFGGAPACSSQSSLDLITGAGFDSAAILGNWTSLGGTSWNGSDDAQGCAASGSVSFTSSGNMSYCYKSATAGTYFLGMMGKGSVGCLGMFYGDTNCTTALGPDFLNLAPTGSATWQDTHTMGVSAPSGTQSILINCLGNGGTGAIDRIYLNRGLLTGF